ncbi:tripartite tricarboxylate transporter substrate-binding protein [Candidatus Skiveiella danica]|uniref:tripartite tricarboxylate transporter substrate-binding protein n=1 Tax=Candidatus Skiveiella danica TaxID=3386177 RepID=UPI0039B98531
MPSSRLRLAIALAFPIRQARPLVVPFAAGGPTDLVARQLAEAMRKPLGGATVVVENAAGAGGTIGTNKVARAAPMATPCCWRTSAWQPRQRFTASCRSSHWKDFEYLGMINDVPMTLMGGKPPLPPNTISRN